MGNVAYSFFHSTLSFLCSDIISYICTNVSDKAISVEILSRAIVRLVFLGLSFFAFLVRVLFSEKTSGPLGTKFPVEWQRMAKNPVHGHRVVPRQ